MDLFCIADYKEYFQKHVDPNISRMFKEQWSLLHIRMVKVNVCARFPFGVEMHYRPYSADRVFELVDSEAWLCGKGAQSVQVVWKPDGPGIFVLQSLPDGPLSPVPFKPGSRLETVATVQSLLASYPGLQNQKDVYQQWMEECFPLYDDVNMHVQLRPLFIPFEDTLFGTNLIVNGGCMREEAVDIEDPKFPLLPAVTNTAFLQWSGVAGEASQIHDHARVYVESGQPAPNQYTAKNIALREVRTHVYSILRQWEFMLCCIYI